MTLEVNDINKHYGSNHVLKDVSFKATNNRTLGLLGRNGHGKSTTMKIIMGIINADSGTVTLDGQKINQKNFKLGYLPEERGLYLKINIVEQMIYFGKLRGLTASEAKKISLEFLERMEMNEYIKKNAGELSKGNQQKIQLALALLNDPDILILDEPYSGLDPVNSAMLLGFVDESVKKGKLVIFSSHQLNTVEEFCDDICIINRGEVVLTGNIRDVKKEYPKRELYIEGEGISSYLEDEKLSENKNGFTIKFNGEEHKKQILSKLSNSNLDVFKIVEPTLLEIFLDKIGESKEGVRGDNE
ncbi:MAG: ATP-binding cassette domain-containing protein [Defluviitaleaceae bacterium]|nr:ATP-binding cassette domain-containing protein [Defluviitaleaceae bacterium]